MASLYPDPKTIVDKPTGKSPSAVLSDFAAIPSPRTYGTLTNFVDTDFRGEGLELQALSLPSFSPNPPFLNKVQDGTVRAWSQTVHGYWTQLIRSTQQNVLCDGKTCESSLIPLNHTFVVPGGRFREQCVLHSSHQIGASHMSPCFRLLGLLLDYLGLDSIRTTRCRKSDLAELHG